jgi:hypothetical protein
LIKDLDKNIKTVIDNKKLLLDNLTEKNDINMNILFEYKKSLFEQYSYRLKNLNPLDIMDKGFSIVSVNGNIVKSINDVKKDDLIDIKGIIALKYRPDRDGDSAPSDLEVFLKKLSKEDTFQTGKPFENDNIWTIDDPLGEMDWGGTLRILAETAYVTKITIKNAPKSLKAGGSVTLKATVKPSFATTKTVKWSVSDKKYAKISKKGKLTVLAAGKGKTVKVTATATDGSKTKATVKIKIK